MPAKISNRKPRADAERNRERLLEVAKAAFSERGSSVSLEEIARTAGVGIGTLYRHFPTREELVDEIYRKRGEKLMEAADRLAKDLPPMNAVREWLFLYIDYLSNKEIMGEILNSLTRTRDPLCPSSGEKVVGALAGLLQRATDNGDIIREISPLDILCAITGIAGFQAGSDWETSAKRLINITLSGLRCEEGRV